MRWGVGEEGRGRRGEEERRSERTGTNAEMLSTRKGAIVSFDRA